MDEVLPGFRQDNIINISPIKQNYNRFTKALKIAWMKNIPQGFKENYIPGLW